MQQPGRQIPGEYRLVISGLPPDVFIAEASLSGHDLLTENIQILEPQADLRSIGLSARSGRLSGVVVDARSKSVAKATVVLIPDRQRNRPDLYKTAATASDGRFTIEGIAPGDYTVFSWEELEAFSYFNPDVVRQYETHGKPVHVMASSSEELQITRIPASAN